MFIVTYDVEDEVMPAHGLQAEFDTKEEAQEFFNGLQIDPYATKIDLVEVSYE